MAALMRARSPEAALAVVLRLLVAQRLADTAGLPGADRQGVYEPQRADRLRRAHEAGQAGRAALRQAAPCRPGGRAGAARAGVAGRAGRASSQEQRAKLAAGEPIRCECCLRMIESADEAAEKDGTLVHVGDCEQQWGSADDDSDDRTTARRRSTRQPDQHRPPYLLTSIAGETQMHYSTHKWVESARVAVVLSVAKLTPGQERYYERSVAAGLDDYYAGRGESPGVWTGRGAQSARARRRRAGGRARPADPRPPPAHREAAARTPPAEGAADHDRAHRPAHRRAQRSRPRSSPRSPGSTSSSHRRRASACSTRSATRRPAAPSTRPI